jgi:lambda repressor-like predicted transcriptional regulator
MPKRKSPGSIATRRRDPQEVNNLRARIEVEAARLGWSLAEVARRMGITPTAFGSILRRQTPKDETIDRIAAALEIDRETLLRPVNAKEYGATMMPRG